LRIRAITESPNHESPINQESRIKNHEFR